MFRHYLLLSLKVLLRRKLFTFISIFGISFTLMVLMVLTAMADHQFGPGKPESRLDRMLGIRNATMLGPNGRWNSGPGFALLDRYARDIPGVDTLSIYTGAGPVALYHNGEKFERDLRYTDGEFWQILDFDFIEGAPFAPADVAEARQVAVINRNTRQRLFGDADAIGRTLNIGDANLRVVGVVDDVSIFRRESYADIWAPYTTRKPDANVNELVGRFRALALAESRAAMPGIREEFNARLARVELPDPRQYDTIVAPLETQFEAFARQSPVGNRNDPEPQTSKLFAMFGVIGLLFLTLPTVNLINLNISRIMERSSEIGVRKAFGAPARTLVAQFVVENVVLTLTGALLGLVASAFVLQAINRSGIAPYAQLAVNPRVFTYGVLLAVIFGLLSGVYPAWRMARLNAVHALKGGSAR